jgi:hypothetical protein
MAKITIDEIEYDTDEMSDDAKAQLQNVLFCDRKIADLKNEMAVLQTARSAYARNLSQQLQNGNGDS